MAEIKLQQRVTQKNNAYQLIEPQRVPEGYLLVDLNDGWNGCAFLFGAVWLTIWCGVSFPMFAIAIMTLLQQPNLSNLGLVAFTSIFAAIGAIGLGWGIGTLYRLYRIRAGEIILSTYPLYQGETYRIKYRRRMRHGKTHREATLSAQWVNYEWVQYRRGTDTETATHELSSKTFPERSVMAGVTQFEYEAQITIPEDGIPSITAPNNQVRWELRVNLHLPQVAKDTSFFMLKVLPRRR